MNNPFSSFLTKLIEDSGLGKNSIIRNTGINRSSFYKFLNGSRIPTKVQYDDIKRVLPLSAKDIQKLDELYALVTLGVDVTHNRKAVIRCLETVASYEDTVKSAILTRRNICEFHSERSVFNQKHEVIALLESFLDRQFASGTPEFDAFLPTMEESFYTRMNMLVFHRDIRHAEIRNLVQFPKGKGGASIDSIIDNYNTMLLFAVGGFRGFHSFYFYDDSVIENNPGVLYPYFIVDDSEAIFLSKQCSYAVRITEPVLIEQFRKQINAVFADAHEAKVQSDELATLVDAIEEYGLHGVNCWHYGGMANLLMLIEERTLNEIKELRPYAQRIRKMQEFMAQKQLTTEFLSMDGLRRFANDGTSCGLPFPSEYRFSLEERIEILHKIDEALGESYYILDETKIPVIKNWIVTLVEGRVLAVVHCGKTEVMAMKEQNLINAFSDFMGSLPLSDQVLTPQEAHRNMQKLLCELEKQFEEQELRSQQLTG